jgi:8-oxo-dGTP pyrophosphatase MutT (NUDIX family)
LSDAERSSITVADVRRALADRGPGGPPEWTVPGARSSAVLIPLFDEGGEAHVVLTRRSNELRNHQGQVAFPGGRQDPGESLEAAALREAWEEVGIEPASVDVVGELDLLTTVASAFVIAPFVGVLPARPLLRPNPAEIDRAFDVPLSELLHPDAYRAEEWGLPWGEREVSFFELEGETVWGATARILQQLLTLVTVPAG